MMRKHLGLMGNRAAGAMALSLAVLLAAAGCGSSDSANYSSKYAAEDSMAAAAPAEYKSFGTSALYDSADMEMEEAWDGDVDAGESGGSVQAETPQDTSRKLITTIHISAETDDMDPLLSLVNGKVEQLGGYIEHSDISNGSYHTYSDKTRRYRSASLTIRIPAKNLQSFVDDVSDAANITDQSKNVEDVTLSYTDLESHKRMLKKEEDRLLEFMSKAETIEDMITVESRLTDVQYQLDSMESQLRTYDNQINYSTVYLNIEEVVEFTVTTEPQTIWEEIAEGFSENLHSVGMGLRNFFVWFVTHIPQLVVWAVVIAIIVVIWRKLRAKRMNRLAEEAANGTGRPLTKREERRLRKMAEKKARKEGGKAEPASYQPASYQTTTENSASSGEADNYITPKDQ